MDAVDRAKKALNVTTDLAFSKAIGVASSAIGGYKRRNSVPLEQLTKIAEMTGADLNWLILGSEPKAPSNLSVPEQMLLTGFRSLDTSGQNSVIQYTLQLTQTDGAQNKPKEASGQRNFGDIGNYNEGDGYIGTINVGKDNKK